MWKRNSPLWVMHAASKGRVNERSVVKGTPWERRGDCNNTSSVYDSCGAGLSLGAESRHDAI
jgi:hypothetical protein